MDYGKGETMADVIYPKAKEAFFSGSIDLTTDDIRVILVDTADYTYSTAHDFLDDVPAGARVAVSGSLTSKSVTDGVFDAADVTFSSVTGDVSEAVIFYKHTGTESTSNLIAYIDSWGDFPVTPNGGDITLEFNASGIITW